MEADRWPPCYDAEELKKSIQLLTSASQVSDIFYGPLEAGDLYQGDIIELRSPIPFIWEDGNPGIGDEFENWLVVGNSCDIHRTTEDASVTQILPIVPIPSANLGSADRNQFLTYRYYRRFYLPPWDDASSKFVHFADFMRPVTIYQSAIENSAQRIASLNYHSWLLLNSCLVRFMARDDGRYD